MRFHAMESNSTEARVWEQVAFTIKRNERTSEQLQAEAGAVGEAKSSADQ